MKFQGMARREKGSEKWPDCGRLLRLVLLRREGRFSRNFRAGTTNAAWRIRASVQASHAAQAALSDADDDVAHRFSGLDRFVRGHDLAEVERLRHVMDELSALEHAGDVGARAGAQLRRHLVNQEKFEFDAVLKQELERDRGLGC